jgi:hypothetical protein
VTQRLAFLMEAVVLTMKAHSYLTVNRHLALEVALGGPGTGEKVLEATAAGAETAAVGAEAAAAGGAETAAAAGAETGEGQAAASPNDEGGGRLDPSRGTGVRQRQRQRAAATGTGPAGGPTSPSSPPPHDATSPAPLSPRRSSGALAFLHRTLAAVDAQVRSEIDLTAVEKAAASGRVSGSSIDLGLDLDRGRDRGRGRGRGRECGGGAAGVGPEAGAGAGAGANDGGGGGGGGGGGVRAWLHAAGRTLIRGISQSGRETLLCTVPYPGSACALDFIAYTVAPTLCYEPNYPRTTSISPAYLAEKLFLAAGLVWAGLLVYAGSLRPVLARVNDLLLLDAIAQLIVPTILVVLIIFFVVFECILNAAAEVTFFAARDTYGEWWDATSFAEFSRKWNLPVHEFLLRHVYLDFQRGAGRSRRRGGGGGGGGGEGGGGGRSPAVALYLTYGVSIVAHEIIISGALGFGITPYLSILSLAQFPLLTILRLPAFKGKRLGNLFFWTGLMFGVTLVLVLYAREYSAAAGGGGGAQTAP